MVEITVVWIDDKEVGRTLCVGYGILKLKSGVTVYPKVTGFLKIDRPKNGQKLGADKGFQWQSQNNEWNLVAA